MTWLLLLSALSQAVETPDDPQWTVRMDSGMRPLGLPIGTLIGGGLRVGKPLGFVTPYAGGSAAWGTWSNAVEEGNNSDAVGGALYTGTLGARIRVAQLPAAETFLVLGGLYTYGAGWTTPNWDNGRTTVISVAGPGAYLGGGADAWLNPRVSVGLEAGVAYQSGNLGYRERSDAEAYDDLQPGNLLYSYSALDLTLWLGGGQ